MSTHPSPSPPGAPSEGAPAFIFADIKRPFALVVIFLTALFIASTWLVFPYFVKDQNLLSEVGGTVKEEKLSNSVAIGRFLTRSTFGAGEAQVDMLYATPKFFEITGQAKAVSEFRPDQYHVFIVTETTHIEELPSKLPEATLFIDGKPITAYDVEGPLEVYHHRVVTIRFPAFQENGRPTIPDGTKSIRLELINTWDYGDFPREAEWALPLDYPETLVSDTIWTPLIVLGLSAGLLSFVLTPCLIQLLVVYLATLSGLAVNEQRGGHGVSKRHVLGVATGFGIGITTLFTATGAFIGEAGKTAQLFFAVWSPTLTVAAGALVCLMAIWVGIQSRSPIVCKLVSPKVQTALQNNRHSYLVAGLTSVGFSLGCLTCFGGAIIATLLVYVGALGSAWVGAAVMLAFSMGVVIPFFLAALFLSRMLPVLEGIQRYSPTIGLVSMIVMLAFGLVLLTDNFHVLSDAIYPYLGLD